MAAVIQTRYRKAVGKDIDEDEQKRVWKLHFARQITIAEQTTIITFRSIHLEITEMREIKNLIDGKFDEQVSKSRRFTLTRVRTRQDTIGGRLLCGKGKKMGEL